MVILQAARPAYVRLRDALAAIGMVVVGVEYRNGAGVLGDHPFPARPGRLHGRPEVDARAATVADVHRFASRL